MGALLDPVIVSNIDIVVDSEVIGVDRSISDHNATMINIKIPYSIKKTYMRKVWQYKHVDLLKLNNEISEFQWESYLKECTDIDIMSTITGSNSAPILVGSFITLVKSYSVMISFNL
jgi:hypothetical protein